ncbi:MAG: ParB/Srx family N-terminal domain-containing protein [Bacteroidales bacterium]|jgi:hypothetical protein|nr:ParB/Srx family N-terminal domain-containing protein [Bacteroidales bacterium]
MHKSELEVKVIDFGKLYLDPNNPRFWTEKSFTRVPDKKISDDTVQATALKNMLSHDISELKYSILRNGFLPLDRIVVREFDNDKYVVIEGNRRLTALKVLKTEIEYEEINEEGITPKYLENFLKTIETIEVLVYTGSKDSQDITWMLQGIRHIGGIKKWEPAQSAKVLADKIEKNHETFTQAGQTFGISAKDVGKRYRAYKALEQMQNDDEYGKQAQNNYYSLFEEAIARRDVKNWLGWDENEYLFKNSQNIKDFYNWICPNKDIKIKSSDGRKINEPKQIRLLSELIKADQVGLLSEEYHIEDAVKYLESPAFDYIKTFDRVLGIINQIPNSAFDESGFISKAEELKTKVELLITRAKAT